MLPRWCKVTNTKSWTKQIQKMSVQDRYYHGWKFFRCLNDAQVHIALLNKSSVI